MNQHWPVDSFISSVQRRLNRNTWSNTLVGAIILGATAMIVIALTYIVRGHAVPTWWYGLVTVLTVVVAWMVWLQRRVDADAAARFADRYFELDDSVTSCKHFATQGLDEGFYQLQAKQTQRRIDGLEAGAIQHRLPPRGKWLSVGLTAIAVLLGFVGPSDAVQQRLAQQQQVLEQTRQVNEELEELVEQLDDEVEDDQEREAIDPNKLRRWVDELKETTELKEALRQYAGLERKINDASARLEQKRDEQLLDRAAKELEKDRESKELAESLQQKKYDKAADELKKLSPDRKKPLNERQKELARLKAAAKRMATAARAGTRSQGNKQSNQQNRNSNAKPNSKKSSSQSTNSKSTSKAGDQHGEPSEGEQLDELLEELEDAVEDLDDAMQELAEQQAKHGELGELSEQECQQCQGAVEDKLGDLGRRLKKMAIKRRARNRLAKLCQSCSQCQGGMCNGSPVASPNAGGKKAGWGSSDSRRDEKDELVDNGQNTKLKGIKGRGPSLTTVESADEGSGVATQKRVDRQRTFQRQLESFVQREDVPTDVRNGVKRYFENIHEVDNVEAPPSP